MEKQSRQSSQAADELDTREWRSATKSAVRTCQREIVCAVDAVTGFSSPRVGGALII